MYDKRGINFAVTPVQYNAMSRQQNETEQCNSYGNIQTRYQGENIYVLDYECSNPDEKV